MVLFSILFFTLTHANAQRGESFEIVNINSTAGLYIEEISDIRFFHQEWTVVTYINMSTYQEESGLIRGLIKSIEKKCQDIEKPTLQYWDPYGTNVKWCGNITSKVKTIMRDLELQDAKWRGTPTERHRSKRGLANATGKPRNQGFGTLTIYDAEDYLTLFETIIAKNNEPNRRVLPQTSLIPPASEYLKEERAGFISIIENSTHEFDQIVQQISNNRKDGYDYNVRMAQFRAQVQNWFIEITILIMRLGEKQRHLQQVLSDGLKTFNSPTLIDPSIFINELYDIRDAIAADDLDLPLPIAMENLAMYYRISSTTVRIIREQMIISFTIPLVNTRQYHLYKITSLPYRIYESIFGFISPSNDYVALNKVNEKYVFLSNNELNQCHNIFSKSLLCQLSNPIVIANKINLCEINIIKQIDSSKTCVTRLANFTEEVWIRLREPNSWIYVLPHKTNVYVSCSNAVANNVLLGTGKITIGVDCYIQTDNVKIVGHKTTENHAIIQNIIPQTDIYSKHLSNNHLKFINKVTAIDTPVIIEFGQSDKLKGLTFTLEQIEKSNINVKTEWFINNINIISCLVFTPAVILLAYMLISLAQWLSQAFAYTELPPLPTVITDIRYPTIPPLDDNSDYMEMARI